VIQNGLPDPDSDADHHQNVISWSLGHTPALCKISSKSVGNFFDYLVNPVSDIRLLDPDGDPDRHQNLTSTPPRNSSKSVHNFFSYPTDRQTDRSKNITFFFGGGKNSKTD